MRLSFLSIEQMKFISGPWVTSQRPLLAGNQMLSAFLEELEAAHNGLLIALPEGPRVSKEAQEKSSQQEELDILHHDPLVRGIDSLLESCMYFAKTPEEEARYAALREKILPYGRSITQKTYAEEGGAAELLEARLTDEDKKQMANIPVVGGSLLDRVNELISYGKQIGALEKEKLLLLKAAADIAPPTTRAQSRDARHRWMQVVNLFLGAAALAKLDTKTSGELFGSLEREEQLASAKQRAKKPATEPPSKPQ